VPHKTDNRYTLVAGKIDLDKLYKFYKQLQKLFNKASPSAKSGSKPLTRFINPKFPLYVKDIIKKPNSYWGKSAQEISQSFEKAGFKTVIRPSKQGSKRATIVEIKGHPEIQQIQVHPGGGRHDGPYIKFSTSTHKIVKIVDPKTYIIDPKEKATILFIK
jgi:hypothetical protein